ncbi:uncharacterized protein HMPREF1541_08296 [Cyphellophora europaea CBS 101466]|uniref:Uncharacterized protein n=1 Tax=Cyphellophora europaea (strain CBS 101466) TaxID=1220924 RepID=W2RLW8_CYPE1|nr:uncharacterized protein HMPREF1541_08296 [Cyphellophora europaea CBS 101466]ETN37305.1 hypothetical protein HMPREF1541_08296 [Cyphellophora europaea CBS 101466]
MGRTKQTPTHNPNAQRPDAPQTSFHPGPGSLMLAAYSDNPDLPSRIATAYPHVTEDPDAAYNALQLQRSWQQSWFTNLFDSELRREIYKYVFEGGFEYVQLVGDGKFLCIDDDKISGILQACKKTRHEAMPLYHGLVTIDIGYGQLPWGWFLHSEKINYSMIKHVSFQAWSVVNPAFHVVRIVAIFQQLKTLTIEAPPNGFHMTITGPSLLDLPKDRRTPGFNGLVNANFFKDELAAKDFLSGVSAARLRDFQQAMHILHPAQVRVLLAVNFNLYSDLWVTWPALKGESLEGLIAPVEDDEMPYMCGIAVIDTVANKVELVFGQHSVEVDLD